MIIEGNKAPEFDETNQDGEVVSLKSLKGKKVVVYFYPKDNTPGCTIEAKSFRDHNKELKDRGVVVLGVSPDKQKSHRNFCNKYELNFDLLVDETHELAQMYGVWGEKKMYGKVYMGIIRSTFIIDEDGVVMKAYYNIKADGHGEEVVAWLSENA
ncbi:MAG: thioredoxin-dependent thiol peroxidase [Vallitaleaceae bacterium]|jgi:peroxiredoxin Q/BCP|nr:thioredoxin-dependent thiol peroxidase [Vallitaleaceae bacterium]